MTDNTITIKRLFEIVDEEIKKQGFEAKHVKLAKSMCRDDSTGEVDAEAENIGYVDVRTQKFIMHLEGAAAVPNYGEALVGAFYHHIPDNGVGIIVFAPHYGVDTDGKIGLLNREGQAKTGISCGANVGLVGLWKKGQYGPYENDPELSAISKILEPDRQKILESQEPIKTIAECEYTRFLEIITNYVKSVQGKEEHKFPILIASGIHIDTLAGQPNKFDLNGLTWVNDGKVSNVNYQV